MRRAIKRSRRAWSRFWAGARYKLRDVSPAALVARLRVVQRLRGRTERNIWYLYVEVFWSGIFMAVMAFNATYALRLGASNTLIGWLSSIPSLLAMVVLVPSARLLESKSNRAPWLHWSLYIGRAAFIGAALSPWLVKGHTAEAVIAVLIARSIPMTFFSAGFEPLFSDVVPIRDRATVVSNRSIIQSVTVAICTYLFGKWLDLAATLPWAGFPVNFQVTYVVGAVAGVMSAYYVSRVKVPETPVIARHAPRLGSLPKMDVVREQVRTMVRENRDFVRIVSNTFIFNFGAWLVGPLYIIFFVKQLRASDGWVGLNTTLAQIGVIGGYLLWRKVMDRKGAGWTLLFTVPLSAIYAFLVAFFPDLNMILAWGVVINLINPGLNLAHGNTLYMLCPPERRATYLAVFSTVSNVGAFVAPMLGVALSAVIDIRWLLLIGGAIRLFGAGMFYVFRIGTPEAAAR